MKSFYQSYVLAFVKFAQRCLDNQSLFHQLSRYAILINQKADELLKRAALNVKIDLPKLRKEIYELGILYVHKFSEKMKFRSKQGTKD